MICPRCDYPQADHDAPCERGYCACGTLTDHIVVVSRDGVDYEGHVCRPCFARAQAEAAQRQAAFARLLSMGASPEAANRIMIRRMELGV